MKRKASWVIFIAVAVLATSCSTSQVEIDPRETLAVLPEAEVPRQGQDIVDINIDQVVIDYRKALAITSDPQVRQYILTRLADLEITRSEQNQLASDSLKRFYDTPIAQYNELIKYYESTPEANVETADVLYYQLAKAYSLDGRTEEAGQTLDALANSFPGSEYRDETQFRRAEQAFSDGEYAKAESLYKAATAAENETISENSQYMQGWSQYKRGRYLDAIETFNQLLLNRLGQAINPEDILPLLETLTPAGRTMVDDALRVISYSFANLEGPISIAEFQEEVGRSAYQYLLYSNLGDLYLEQERYQDSADTFLLFVKNNPNANLAPDFSLRTIVVYEKGNFPSLILPAKQNFVESYGVNGQFWQMRAKPKQTNNYSANLLPLSRAAMEKLHTYIIELAQYEHARAQGLIAQTVAPEAGVDIPTQVEIKATFALAAKWYQEFIQTFPNDNNTGEMTFLMAEAFNQSGETLAALKAYETVAFIRQDKKYGAEAGYSAVLLARELLAEATAADDAANILPGSEGYQTISQGWQWQQQKIENALRFAQLYADDPRAVLVLGETAPALLAQGDLVQAEKVAKKVIAWSPQPAKEVLYSAWLVLGHSRFDQALYAGAENAYWKVLGLQSSQTETSNGLTKTQLRERIAASIYKQAQAALLAEKPTTAIRQFLRITDELPDTSIAVQALFDAGHAAQQNKDWPQAEILLARFRATYPNHALSAQLPAKLILVYQAQGDWRKAAEELSRQSRAGIDPEVARQSLYLAAEYYDKVEDWALTRDHYRTYANTYGEPLNDLIEAQQRLSELYAENKEPQNRDFWLKKLMTSYKSTKEPSPRAHFLAAQATSLFAGRPYQKFIGLSLTLPLDKSLGRKKKALERALAAQKDVLNFKVAEFTTQANFYIGEIYTELSRALMDSERPTNLDVLELEQYDILLEEQAYPFEEKAIGLHTANAERSWAGIYDPWVQKSIDSLAKILPARFGKKEVTVEASDEIF